jgi:hypothetical protein
MVRPTDEGERLLRTNPNLGISARIIEGYERSDGRYFPAAFQHVLGTLDPRIPALGPWEPVAEMSNEGPVPVLDLSKGYYFEGQRHTVDLAALVRGAPGGDVGARRAPGSQGTGSPAIRWPRLRWIEQKRCRTATYRHRRRRPRGPRLRAHGCSIAARRPRPAQAESALSHSICSWATRL